MSFGDEACDVSEPEEKQPRATGTVSAAERALLGKRSWSMDELISLAFLARRLVAWRDAYDRRNAEKTRRFRERKSRAGSTRGT